MYMKIYDEYNHDFVDFELNNYDEYDSKDNIFEIRTLSKTEFNRLLKTIEKIIKETKKNKQ